MRYIHDNAQYVRTFFLSSPSTTSLTYQRIFTLEERINLEIHSIEMRGIGTFVDLAPDTPTYEALIKDIEFYLAIDKTLQKDVRLYPMTKNVRELKLINPIVVDREIGIYYKFPISSDTRNPYRTDNSIFNIFYYVPYTLIVKGRIIPEKTVM